MANRYRQSARANSGDWKFEVRDWPANWPAQTISGGLRSPRPQRPRNAGLCAGHDEVSDFRECVAGAGGFEPPDGGIKIRCLTTWLRPNASQGSNGLGGKRADNSSGSPAPQWPRRTKFAPAEGSPRTPNALNQEQCVWSRDAPRHPVLKRPDFVSPLRGVRPFAIGVASPAPASSKAGSRSDRFSVDIAGGR